MSNKNRTVVKDGRIQVKKKRTDRSYLRPEAAASPAPATESEAVEELVAPSEAPVAAMPPPATEPAPEAPAEDPVAAFTPPPPAPSPVAPAPVTAAAVAAAPRTGAARALQQQGVRKRREVDLNELGRRDSTYAMHELRRIAILTAIVVVTLVVLAIFLR